MSQEIKLHGDVYFGNVKGKLPHGMGSYTWSDGTVYDGYWEDGKMCGRGRISWSSGTSYEGDFSGGYLHGFGTLKTPDGSVYKGSWRLNIQNGVGRKEYSNSDVYDGCWKDGAHEERNVTRTYSEKITFSGFFRESGRITSRRIPPDDDYALGDSTREFSASERTEMFSHISDEGGSEVDDDSTVAWEREYMQGVLMKERVKNHSGALSSKSKQSKRITNESKQKSCVDIFEGHKSYCLMLNLQLGIRYTVGKITPVPMREVRSSDFGERARIRMYFPRKGSQFTPPHYSVDFHWKDYCPMVFRNLREMFKLDAAEYMMSICGDDGLRELSSPGKSGSLFYLSHDDRFVIKTLRRSELKVLLKMLPSYYDHVKKYDNTLITKFFGLHEITLRGGKKVRFIVMGNMFKTELRIHRRYDLKGSYQGRFTNKDHIDEGTTLKDLDLAYEFHMDRTLREALFEQIQLDCSFLESQQIIDYSLLLGLHFRAPEHLKALLEAPDAEHGSSSSLEFDDGSKSGELSIPPTGLLLVTHEPSSVNTAPGPHIRGNTLRAFSVGDKEVDLLLPGTGRLRVQLGVNMPAQANRKVSQEVSGSTEVELFEVYDVVLYLGIIDILQDYNMRKKIEQACKSVRYDPISISVADPKFYSKRFIDFLHKVFPVDP